MVMGRRGRNAPSDNNELTFLPVQPPRRLWQKGDVEGAILSGTTTPISLTYLFDPLCGWCYGASPTLQRLTTSPGIRVTLAPTGLFSGPGARPMDQDFAAYAWSHDQRIAKLSGQAFSEAYRVRVLGAIGQRLDSGPATRALTAVWMVNPLDEARALQAIQAARYVEGRDVTAKSVLIDVLNEAGFSAAAEQFWAADEHLEAAMAERVRQAQGLMRGLGIQGVPALLTGEPPRALPAGALFRNFDELLSDLALPQPLPA